MSVMVDGLNVLQSRRVLPAQLDQVSPRRFRPQREIAQCTVFVVLAVDVLREAVRAGVSHADLHDLTSDSLGIEQRDRVAAWWAFVGDVHGSDRFQILSGGGVIHPNVVLFLAVFERCHNSEDGEPPAAGNPNGGASFLVFRRCPRRGCAQLDNVWRCRKSFDSV